MSKGELESVSCIQAAAEPYRTGHCQLYSSFRNSHQQLLSQRSAGELMPAPHQMMKAAEKLRWRRSDASRKHLSDLILQGSSKQRQCIMKLLRSHG